MKLPKTCPNCLKELHVFDSEEDLFHSLFICGDCGKVFQQKLVEVDSEQKFVVPLKKWGNSYVLKVPPSIAKIYKLGQEMQVIIKV